MKIFWIDPSLTKCEDSHIHLFMDGCNLLLDKYASSFLCHIKTEADCFNQMIALAEDDESLVCFFVGNHNAISTSVYKYLDEAQRCGRSIWPIALNKEYRIPCAPVSGIQSFDVQSYLEKRNWPKDNYQSVGQIFARMIIGKALFNVYRDDLQYFISHRRNDGEDIAKSIEDKIGQMNLGTHIVYRDVSRVKVGDRAQIDIDINLRKSDVVIFLHTNDCENSTEVFKELSFAMVQGIPILWIQIDGADPERLHFLPCEKPHLRYKSSMFHTAVSTERICNEIERACFELLMSSANQILSYISAIRDLEMNDSVHVQQYHKNPYQYIVQYTVETTDKYDSGVRKHFVQCLGRPIRDDDKSRLTENSMDDIDNYVVLVPKSTQEAIKAQSTKNQYWQDNYISYIDNIKANSYESLNEHKKIIVISGAFPNCDEIYKPSLAEALGIYAKEILQNGYVLSFGAHPTFQKIIFSIAEKYSDNPIAHLKMYMDNNYLGYYSNEQLNYIGQHCELNLANGLFEMREKMIGNAAVEAMVCMGGMIKDDKSLQGVDEEVSLAQKFHVPVFLVGTVGGRSDQMAKEYAQNDLWEQINSFGADFNIELMRNINHYEMSQKLFRMIRRG